MILYSYIAYTSQSLVRIQLSSKLVRGNATHVSYVNNDRGNATITIRRFLLRWIVFCYKLNIPLQLPTFHAYIKNVGTQFSLVTC